MKFCLGKISTFKIAFICISICVSAVSFGQNIPPVPNPFELANDYTASISNADLLDLNNKLKLIDAKTKNQIAIVILNEIGGYEIADYANLMGRKWGIGNKESNSGVLILIVKNSRKIWFATGYGMEKYLPDITCRKIIQNNISPYFKKGLYYEGLLSGIVGIVENLKNNYDGKDSSIIKFYNYFIDAISNNRPYNIENVNNQRPNLSGKSVLILIFIIIIAIIISRFRGGGGGFFIGGGGFGGGIGSNSGGSFGGGSFGGGGAGGSW